MTSTVSVKASDFVKTATASLEAASKDATVPVLNAIHVFRAGGDLILEATDRYMLVRARLEADDNMSSASFSPVLIDGKALKTAIQGLKAQKVPAECPVTLEVSETPDNGRPTWRLSVPYGWSTAGETAEGAYPKLGALIGGADHGAVESAGTFALAPEILAKVARMGKAADKYSSVKISPNANANKPVAFTIGENIAGMAMPIRSLESESGILTMPDWASVQPNEFARTELQAA